MKVLLSNLKNGEVKVTVESNDDLWYLSTVVEPGDSVSGRTMRKIKVGSSEKEAVRKPVFLAITVEKVEFSESTDALRVLGSIIEGPEDAPKGSHHSFNVEINSRITIVKRKWFSYQIDRLKEAANSEIPKILICVFDREESLFALMARSGYKFLTAIKGDVAKKAVDTKPKGAFFETIIKQLEDYDLRYKLDRIILASPAFWKDELFKVLKNDALRKKVIHATCSSVDEAGINEVLKRDETKEALRLERTSKELQLVESLLSEISKQGKAVYGFKETGSASEMGAVDILLVSDSLIKKLRIAGKFDELDHVMHVVDDSRGKVVIVTSTHEGGKKLDGLGGIAALLRFKLSY